jgi:hypothetical protein
MGKDIKYYTDISELPESIRSCLPEIGQKLYVSIFNRVARDEEDAHKAHFRTIRYFLRGRYVEFISYPNASSPNPHQDLWLKKCLYCNVVWTDGFEFIHAPDCPVQKVHDGLLDPSELFSKPVP